VGHAERERLVALVELVPDVAIPGAVRVLLRGEIAQTLVHRLDQLGRDLPALLRERRIISRGQGQRAGQQAFE
jgi:hypothetical protein